MLSVSIHADTIDVFTQFPTLRWQIENNIEQSMNKNLIISRLRDFFKSNAAEFFKGMQTILAEDFYRKYININTDNFSIDGKYKKWRNVGEVFFVENSTNRPVIPAYDITEFRYFFDRECNLFVMFKAKAKPLLPDKGNQSYIIWVITGSWAQIRLQFINKPAALHGFKVYDNRMPLLGDMGYGKWYGMEYEYKTLEIAEAKIPLGTIFNFLNIQLPDVLTITPEARYQAPAREYFNPLKPLQIKTNYKNPALKLLMQQLSNGVNLKAGENPLFTNHYSYIISQWSNLVVDLLGNNTNEEANIGQWYHLKSPNQRWRIVPFESDGYCLIFSGLTGKCLDVLERNGKLFVVQKNFNNADTQKWKIVDRGNGLVSFVSKKYNRAIDIENSSKQRWTFLVLTEISAAGSQLWKIQN